MSESKHRDFLDYWDSRFDENEKILNNYPQLANFTFRECQKLWNHLHTDYEALLARHNALRGAVAWERECETLWNENIATTCDGAFEVEDNFEAARAEVDRLLEES